MSPTAKIIAIAVCVSLVGCADMAKQGIAVRGEKPPNGPKKPKDCKGSNPCDIGVSVDTTNPASPRITIPNDNDWFASIKKNGTTTIGWTLQGAAGYTFDQAKGIDFFDSNVPCNSMGTNPPMYSCKITHSGPDTTVYKYSVKIVPMTGSSLPTPPVLDPWVIAE
jgi:hypothetical protein